MTSRSWSLGLAVTMVLCSCSGGGKTASTGTGPGGAGGSTASTTSSKATTASSGSTVSASTTSSSASSTSTTSTSTTSTTASTGSSTSTSTTSTTASASSSTSTGSTSSASASSSTGGTCMGNVCNATVIDPGFHFARAIAVDATDVVWVDNNGIWRAPKDGSGSGTELTSQTFATNSIAIAGTNVYYASPGGGLYVVPKAGGTPATVTGGANFQTVATDGVNAYTVVQGVGGTFSLPLAGGTPTRLPTVANDPYASAECFSTAYALDGSNLWVGCIVGMTQNRVFLVPTSGAASTSWPTVFYPVTTNSTLVIGEVTTTAPKVDVQIVDKATVSAPTTIIPNAQVSDLHVDDANLWYLDGFTGQGQLYRAPFVANATPTSVAGPGLVSEAFAMDATYLYFADASGRIVRISQ